MPVVADSPSLIIGVVDGDPDYQFVDVEGATRRRDGTIVVADRGTSNLRFYDPRGKLIRKSGRNGSGPGEFRMLGEFVPLENGFLVTDWRLPRISLLDSNGKYQRSLTDPDSPVLAVEGYQNGIPHYRYWLLGEVPPYIIALRTDHPSMTPFRYKPNVVFRDTVKYMRLEIPKGEAAPLKVVDTIAVARGVATATRMSRIPNGSWIQVARPVLFAPWPEIAIGRDRVYVADSDSFVVRVFDMRGQLIHTISDQRELLPVDDSDIAAAKARMSGNSRDEQGQPFAPSETKRWIEWVFANVPLSKTKPARSRMLVDGKQNLWVQDYSVAAHARSTILINTSKGEDGRWWTIFDKNGAKLGRIELPKGLIVVEVGTDYLLGLAVDDLDVQTIVVYPLR